MTNINTPASPFDWKNTARSVEVTDPLYRPGSRASHPVLLPGSLTTPRQDSIVHSFSRDTAADVVKTSKIRKGAL